jgi:hypothetical protein
MFHDSPEDIWYLDEKEAAKQYHNNIDTEEGLPNDVMKASRA